MADGLKTALALLATDAEPLERHEQLGLLGDEAEPNANLPLADSTVRRPGARGGRPAGSLNRSTQAWVRFIQTRYRSPLVGLAETWSRSVRDLASELELYCRGADGKPIIDDGKPRLNLVEAFKLQQSAMASALPYLHSRMPQAVTVEAKTRGLLVIGDLGAETQGDVLTLNLADYEEKQEFSEAAPEKSDAEKVGQ